MVNKEGTPGRFLFSNFLLPSRFETTCARYDDLKNIFRHSFIKQRSWWFLLRRSVNILTQHRRETHALTTPTAHAQQFVSPTIHSFKCFSLQRDLTVATRNRVFSDKSLYFRSVSLARSLFPIDEEKSEPWSELLRRSWKSFPSLFLLQLTVITQVWNC